MSCVNYEAIIIGVINNVLIPMALVVFVIGGIGDYFDERV